jgi:hypothetical protein
MNQIPLVIESEEDEIEFRLKLPIMVGNLKCESLFSFLMYISPMNKTDVYHYIVSNDYLFSKIVSIVEGRNFYIVRYEDWVSESSLMISLAIHKEYISKYHNIVKVYDSNNFVTKNF